MLPIKPNQPMKIVMPLNPPRSNFAKMGDNRPSFRPAPAREPQLPKPIMARLPSYPIRAKVTTNDKPDRRRLIGKPTMPFPRPVQIRRGRPEKKSRKDRKRPQMKKSRRPSSRKDNPRQPPSMKVLMYKKKSPQQLYAPSIVETKTAMTHQEDKRYQMHASPKNGLSLTQIFVNKPSSKYMQKGEKRVEESYREGRPHSHTYQPTGEIHHHYHHPPPRPHPIFFPPPFAPGAPPRWGYPTDRNNQPQVSNHNFNFMLRMAAGPDARAADEEDIIENPLNEEFSEEEDSDSVETDDVDEPQEPPALCLEKPEKGDCDRVETRYFFNKETLSCQVFLYSGCGGTENMFTNAMECRDTCLGKSVFVVILYFLVLVDQLTEWLSTF